VSKEITVECECRACGGTGLYVGLGERDGAAVVCSRCKGSGKSKVTYRPFEGRKTQEGVTQVFAANPGVVLAPSVTPGGVPYESWLSGDVDPRWSGCEAREHSCPMLWYQSADYEKKPEWDECVGWGSSISACQYYGNRAACWARWDKERR
jgi:hypothetical protein